jgi:hypothetical protein
MCCSAQRNRSQVTDMTNTVALGVGGHSLRTYVLAGQYIAPQIDSKSIRPIHPALLSNA